jgi:feruloyl-CoA hydratase/lyase
MSAKTSTEKTSTEKVPGGKNVLVEFEDQIAWVTLNRPEKRNCMSPALNDEMVEVLDALELDDRCGVLVLTGAGDSFSAGMDLREFFRATDGMPFNKQMRIRRSAANWQWRQLMNFPKPTIAMVNGWCFGGAFTPLVSCDIAIAADEATFGLSEINWGIIPGGVVTRAVVGSMNVRNAMYHILTGISVRWKKGGGDGPRQRGRAEGATARTHGRTGEAAAGEESQHASGLQAGRACGPGNAVRAVRRLSCRQVRAARVL